MTIMMRFVSSLTPSNFLILWLVLQGCKAPVHSLALEHPLPSSVRAAATAPRECRAAVRASTHQIGATRTVRSRRELLGQGLLIMTTTAFIASSPDPARARDEVSTPKVRASAQTPSASSASGEVMAPRTASSFSTTAVSSSSTAVTATAAVGEAGRSVDWSAVFSKAGKKALGGGRAGASAAVVQVLCLMWLRTCMNYQYRYGGTLSEALDTLWKQGGIPRLYQGLPFALVQGPLTRFGDTAANAGVLTLLESYADLPLPLKTACASITAGAWRVVLMPVDASKTALQVEGADGLGRLWERVQDSGPGVLYRGAAAQVAATAVGHFPWFATYNVLNQALPAYDGSDGGAGDGTSALLLSLVRSAGIGLVASCVSDTASNSLRVIKTTSQTAQLSVGRELSYPEVVSLIVERDGIRGLFGRGLQTRLLTNAIQGSLFSVLWKYFQQAGGS